MTSGNASHDEVPLFGKWMVLLCSILTYGVGIGLPISLSVMFLDWQESFQVSRAYTTMIHSACVGILFGAGVGAGYAINRFGARFTTVFGSVMATVGLVLSAFASDINILIAGTGVIGGLGFCFMQVPTFPCVTKFFSNGRPVIMSMCANAVAIFSIAFRYLFQYLIGQYSWRGGFLIIAGITLNMIIPGLILTSVSRSRQNSSRSCKTDTDVIANGKLCDQEKEADFSPLVLKPIPEEPHTTPKENGVPNGDGNLQIVYDIDGDNISNFETSLIHSSENNNMLEVDKTVSNNYTASDSAIYKKPQISKWSFLKDVVFVMIFIHVGLGSATIFAFTLILMDFSKTNGFDDSTGVLFLTIVFSFSVIGRTLVSLQYFFPKVPTVIIQVIFSIPGGLSAIFLSFSTDKSIIIFLLCVMGLGVGGMVCVYPKSVLDLKSVDSNSYPIALGLVLSINGLMNFNVPIGIGHSVDVTESYTFILIVLGCLNLVSMAGLLCAFLYSRRKSSQSSSLELRNPH